MLGPNSCRLTVSRHATKSGASISSQYSGNKGQDFIRLLKRVNKEIMTLGPFDLFFG